MVNPASVVVNKDDMDRTIPKPAHIPGIVFLGGSHDIFLFNVFHKNIKIDFIILKPKARICDKNVTIIFSLKLLQIEEYFKFLLQKKRK